MLVSWEYNPSGSGLTHLEGQMEVLYVDILVGCRLALAPQQQTLLGGHLLNGDILNGETQNNGPDHAQRHFEIAIDDLLGTDRDQMDTLRCNKIQRLVNIGNFVETHLAAIGLGQCLARDHLQQQHQLEAIAEVLLDVVDGGASFAQMTVAPRGKCLRIDATTMISYNHNKIDMQINKE